MKNTLDEKIRHHDIVMTRKEFMDWLIERDYRTLKSTQSGAVKRWSLYNDKGWSFCVIPTERKYITRILEAK